MSDDDFDALGSRLAGQQAPFGPPRLPVTDVSYTVHRSRILGSLLLAADQSETLVASVFVDVPGAEDRILKKLANRISPRVLRHRHVFDQAISELDEYLDGRRHTFDLALDLRLATPFQRLVLEDVKQHLGYGQVSTYSEVAQHIERPTARRAVGSALGANPVCVFVPCHRVVGAGGALSGYAGGLEAKKHLLELEAARA